MLELKDIRLRIGETDILGGISLKLEDKKIYAVTGPNGSGKSSLAQVIMGIQQPTSGSIWLDGEDMTEMGITERARLGVGYAFQNPPRFKGIKVKELMALSAGADSQKVCDLLFSVGLCSRDYLERDVDATLSGGEIKRIEIASVLARDLKVAVFDEPEAGIDLWSFQKLAETFKAMHGKLNTTIIIISHQERILELADEILLLSEGVIKRHVPKDALWRRGITDGCGCSEECGKLEVQDAQCAR
jgi:Fe-S cluster assembly ATP-binding protein